MKHKVYTKIEGGKITNNRSLFIKILQSFSDKNVVITIEPFKTKRSNRQNAYYWSVIIPEIRALLSDAWGKLLTIEMTHEFLKTTFNSEEFVDEDTGEIYKIPKGTSENNTAEQEMYHEMIRQFAFETFDHIIPLPNEELKLNL